MRRVILICIMITTLVFSAKLVISKKSQPEVHQKIVKQKIVKEELIDDYGDTYNNDDIVGKIKIEGTNILHYILQSSDNDYYLNHNIKKEEDIAGAVFMDYRNNKEDKKILIFGHNARTLKTVPFHDLEKFKDKDFYDKHKYIEIELDGEKSKWLIFSYLIVSKDDNWHMTLNYNDDEWVRHLNYLKDNSIYDTKVNVSSEDRIVILQTCNYDKENSLILISAKEVKQ